MKESIKNAITLGIFKAVILIIVTVTIIGLFITDPITYTKLATGAVK